MSFVHRKCCGITNFDLNNLPRELLPNWRCLTCYKDMFPFQWELTDNMIKDIAFNSNFNCACQTGTYSIDRQNVFKYGYSLANDKYGPDSDDLINKSYDINVKFDYYSVYDFHKLTQKNQKRNKSKTLSIFPFPFSILILNHLCTILTHFITYYQSLI